MSTSTKTKCRILPKSSVLAVSRYDAPPEGRLDAIRLDFNESTSPIANSYPEGMPPSWVSTYPEYSQLVQRLSSRFELDPSNFALTNGSDEGIALVANTFIEYGEDTALVSNPCFVMIRNCLKLAGAKLDEVSVKSDLAFDLDGIEQCLKRAPKLAMFASPDNPTGSVIPVDTIERWCAQYPDVLFVIDEAYGEYAGTTVIPLIKRFENLLVLKTFSKAWGMAGFRLGMVIGSQDLLEFVNRVKLPYSVNSAAVFTALRLLERESAVISRVEETLRQRSKLAETLNKRGFEVKETSANWCLVNAGIQAGDLTRFARERNVLVRNRSTSIFSSCASESVSNAKEPMWGLVRVSAGNSDEMAVFEGVLDEYRTSYGLLFDLDGTLVDTTKSFDTTVAYLVKKFSGADRFSLEELYSLRLEGGFNDDWVASRELLRRRGFEVELKEVVRAGEEYYLAIAKEAEELLIPAEVLKRLRQRCPLFIVTGRTRREYAPVWGSRLDPLFDKVFCVDDVAGLAPKPSPDYLNQVKSEFGIKSGAYIGNSVDDMQSSRAAGLTAIGVADGGSQKTALIEAGAEAIIASCDQIAKLMMV